MKSLIEPLMNVPSYEDDATYYSDWGDPREFSLGDMGVGECAGEIVTREEFELQIAERIVFEAQVALDEGNYSTAKEKSFPGISFQLSYISQIICKFLFLLFWFLSFNFGKKL